MGQLADGLEFGCARHLGLRALEAFVFRRELRLIAQGLLPGAFERARHQPVLRLHRRVLSARPFDLVARALPSLTPMMVERRALGFEISGQRNARFDCRRRHRFEHETSHQIIQRSSFQ